MTLLQVLLDFGLVLLIWLVQLVIYPCFTFMDEAGFQQWHPTYTRLISYFVVPLMLGQAALYGFLLVQEFRWVLLLQALLIALVWANTFLVAVPLHDAVTTVQDSLPFRNQLLRVNWWRTAAWSLVFLLTLGQFFKLLPRPSNF